MRFAAKSVSNESKRDLLLPKVIAVNKNVKPSADIKPNVFMNDSRGQMLLPKVYIEPVNAIDEKYINSGLLNRSSLNALDRYLVYGIV